MLTNVKKQKHDFKLVRRFQEDLWGRYVIGNKSRQVLNFLYEAHQNSFKHRDLLKKRFFFLVRKKERFVYKVVTDEQEFKKKKRTIKINEYLAMLKLRRFYGNLRKKNFKRIFRQKGLNDNFLGRSFAYFLESRLDVILYRANFFTSIYAARQFINHKKVLVNGLIESKPGIKLYVNDIISLYNYKNFYSNIKNKLINKKLLGNYPAYLEVNYKLGLIILTKIPEIKEVPYPFFMNLEKLSQSFLK